MRKVVLKHKPHETVEVSETAFTDLDRQGLVLEDKTPKKDLPKENG